MSRRELELYREMKREKAALARDVTDRELHTLAAAMADAEGNDRRANEVLRVADELLGTHGVEEISGGVMLNAGDIYNVTIIYCLQDRNFEITTHADFYEEYGRDAEFSENPLRHGYSRAAISDNIATEVRAGRDRQQAVAIAYETARKAWREKYPHKALPA